MPRMLPTNEQRNIIMEQETNKKWLSTHSAADMFDFSYGYMAHRLLDMRKNPKYVNAFVGKGRSLRVNAEKLEQYLKEEE